MFLINKKFENSLHIKSLTGELTIKEIYKIILVFINNVNLGHPWHKPYILHLNNLEDTIYCSNV